MKNKNSYFYISLILMIVSNRILFMGSRLVNQGLVHYSLHMPWDEMVPFLPWTILIYNGIYLWWLQAFWLISTSNRMEANRFFSANLLAKAITFLVFILFPTIMVRPTPGHITIWDSMIYIQYLLDAPDNLFPSIHCVIGWSCWIGLRGRKDIAFSWRVTSFIMAIAVCLSTLTVRQHVFVDVIAGITLSEVCYEICRSPVPQRMYSQTINSILHLFPRKATA